MDRRGRIILAAGLLGAVGGGGLLAFFLIRQGLTRASLWGAVLGLPLALVGTAATVWTLVVAIRQSRAGLTEQSYGVGQAIPGADARLTAEVDQVLARERTPEGFGGREAELGRLAEFCDGPDVYVWWRGPPWAGKTTLAAYFALHPPAKVRVVSFLADSRIPGGAGGMAFLLAMIRQLTCITGVPARAAGRSAVEYRDQFLDLLERAAGMIARLDERLIILVDGLDEDQGDPPRILDCLPRHPPDGVKVIVSSRPGLEMPADHPLAQSSCTQIELVPSPLAQHLGELADQELQTHLRKPRRRRLLGLIIASGGGLSARDLAELAGKPVYQIAAGVRPFTRSLEPVSRDGERVYELAHDELQKAAAQGLAGDLPGYGERIHQWYQHYQESGWPHDTPGYLLWRYWHHLRTSADRERLAAVTTDRIRHDRMLELCGSDAPALVEVGSALRRLADQPDPDLPMLALLALERERLASRNHAMPLNLPAVWARLGQVRRALELARSIPEVLDRAEALTMLADAVTGADPALAALALEDAETAADSAPRRDFDHAEKARELVRQTRLAVTQHKDLIWGYPGPEWQWHTQLSTSWQRGLDAVRLQHRLAVLTTALDTIRRDDIDSFGAIISDEDRRRVLVARAEILTSVGSGKAPRLIAAAEQALRSPGGSGQCAELLVTSTGSLTGTGPGQACQSAEVLRDHAAQVTRAITMRLLRAVALTAHAITEASADRVHADALAGEAENIALHAGGPCEYQAVALAAMAVSLAGTNPDRAQSLARQAEERATAIYEPERKAVTQARVAAVLAGTCPDQAARLARAARDCADAIHDPEPGEFPTPVDRPVIRASVAAALASTEPDLADKLADDAVRAARAIARPSTRAHVLAEVADAFAETFRQRAAGLARDAEEAARDVRECGFRAPVLARMAWALRLAGAGATRSQAAEQDWANTNGGHEGAAFETLAAGLAEAGWWGEAECAARAAEIALHPFTGAALSKVAAPMAAAGLCDRAESLADSCGMFRPRVLASIASALARSNPQKAAEKAEAAVQAARQYEAPLWGKPKVFLDTAVALAGAFPEQALDLADDVYLDIMADEGTPGFSRYKGEYLARIAKVRALAGRWDQAQDLACKIGSLADRANAFADIATAAIAAGQYDRVTPAEQAIPAEWLGLHARITASIAGAAVRVMPESAAESAGNAERFARATTNPALMLITAAEALHDSLTPQKMPPDHALHQRARRMLGLALAEEGIEWISAMPVLGKLTPEAVRAFYNGLIDLGASS